MGHSPPRSRGMAAACLRSTSRSCRGNVSLYNETEGADPADAGDRRPRRARGRGAPVGLALAPGARPRADRRDRGHLGQSLWLREIAGREDGPPPPVDLAAERRNGDFVRAPDSRGPVRACHDVSDGGAAGRGRGDGAGRRYRRRPRPPATALPRTRSGSARTRPATSLAVRDAAAFLAAPRRPACRRCALGARGGGKHLTLPDGATISLDTLRAAHERFLPDWMDGPAERGPPMAMAASEIEALIKAALPDARVTIEDLAGDGDHYAATVVSDQLPRQVARAAAPARLCRPARPHGRRTARPRPANLSPRIRIPYA